MKYIHTYTGICLGKSVRRELMKPILVPLTYKMSEVFPLSGGQNSHAFKCQVVIMKTARAFVKCDSLMIWKVNSALVLLVGSFNDTWLVGTNKHARSAFYWDTLYVAGEAGAQLIATSNNRLVIEYV